MYVTLELVVFSDQEEENNILVKRMSENYKSRTFVEVLQQIANPNPDEFNEEGYNAWESELANHVNRLLSDANKEPGSVDLYAYSNATPPEVIHLGLNEKVADYMDRILTYETTIGESGEELKYQKIDLGFSSNTVAGAYNLEYLGLI